MMLWIGTILVLDTISNTNIEWGRILYRKNLILYRLTFEIHKINLIVTWMSQHVGSSLYISNIFQAVNAKFNKIRSLGGRQYQ